MKPLKLAAQLTKANRRSDDSVAITFVTAEEIGTELFTHIDEYRKQNGFVLFKTNDFTDADIPAENAEIRGQKSPSQILRNRLFAKHMHQGGTKETFPEYYKKAMAWFTQSVDDSYED